MWGVLGSKPQLATLMRNRFKGAELSPGGEEGRLHPGAAEHHSAERGGCCCCPAAWPEVGDVRGNPSALLLDPDLPTALSPTPRLGAACGFPSRARPSSALVTSHLSGSSAPHLPSEEPNALCKY